MSREIKFRAWWDGRNEPVTPHMVEWEELCAEHFPYGFWPMQEDSGFTLMQYTSLKDKNGVEIYEGDIGYLVNENNKGVVKYSEEWAAFYFAGDNGSWWCDFCSDQGCSGDSLEVIGNIYENKELLE